MLCSNLHLHEIVSLRTLLGRPKILNTEDNDASDQRTNEYGEEEESTGRSTTLLREEIDELRSTGQSLMPVGLERTISPQQMADLICFLKNWRYETAAVTTPPSTP